MVTPNFFLEFNNTCWDLLSRISIQPRKNTFELVGTVLKYDRPGECSPAQEFTYPDDGPLLKSSQMHEPHLNFIRLGEKHSKF